MNSTTRLNVNVPSADSLEVFIRWDILSHHRMGAESFSSPSGQADHPMEPKKFRLAMRLRSYVPRWWTDWEVIGVEDGLARSGAACRSRKQARGRRIHECEEEGEKGVGSSA